MGETLILTMAGRSCQRVTSDKVLLERKNSVESGRGEDFEMHGPLVDSL